MCAANQSHDLKISLSCSVESIWRQTNKSLFHVQPCLVVIVWRMHIQRELSFMQSTHLSHIDWCVIYVFGCVYLYIFFHIHKLIGRMDELNWCPRNFIKLTWRSIVSKSREAKGIQLKCTRPIHSFQMAFRVSAGEFQRQQQQKDWMHLIHTRVVTDTSKRWTFTWTMNCKSCSFDAYTKWVSVRALFLLLFYFGTKLKIEGTCRNLKTTCEFKNSFFVDSKLCTFISFSSHKSHTRAQTKWRTRDVTTQTKLQRITSEKEYFKLWNFAVSFDVDYGEPSFCCRKLCTGNAYHTNIIAQQQTIQSKISALQSMHTYSFT